MCHADAMSRLPLNDPERDEVPLPAEVVFLLQTLDYSPITSEQIRIMTRRDPVLSKILDYVTTGAWPTNCVDTNLSAYFNKQDEISMLLLFATARSVVKSVKVPVVEVV